MKKKNKLLLLVLAVILIVALVLGVTSFGGGETAADGPTAPVVGTEKKTYTVILKTEGGKALEDVGVYFYTDSTLAELAWFDKTDAEGKVSFTDLESTGYVAVLDKVPEGYKVEPYYPLTGETTEIILSTDMTDGDLANLRYKLGDVMMNFTVTDAEGNTWVLSDLLAEKEAVVLNFWYLQCAPCRAEFPYLQEAYEKYSGKIALIGMNPINDSDEEIRAFAGELGLTFPMAHCDPNWEKAMQITAYPTTVVIDRFGTIALIHTGGIDDSKTFEDAFAFFTGDEYEQTVVEDIKDLEIKAEGSDSSNPISIGSKTSFEVTLAPGQTSYYNIYRVDGMTLSVSSKNISAVYNKTTYPSGNGLSFTVHCPDTYTPAAVSFTNDGAETETFTVRLAAKPGTVDNPHTLKLGEFTVNVEAGNEQGVYHEYTPKEDGLLMVQCTSISPKNVGYGITLTTQKGNATVQRNLAEDGDKETGTVSISVKKGVKVTIVISTLPDDTKSYPAAKLKCTLSIGEDTTQQESTAEMITYAVTVTDQDMIPVENVLMRITQVQPLAEGEAAVSKEIKTGEAGVASEKLKAGTYTVTLNMNNLKQYTAATPEFQLTAERPYASIKLDPKVVERADYTVTVTGVDGNPLAGAVVLLGNASETTDAQGVARFTAIPKDTYTAFVTPPKGYAAVAAGYPFEEGSYELTIVLEEGSSDTEGSVKYTVEVVDYDGKAQSGVAVQIVKDGVPVTSPIQTDASGKVETNLEPGSYTVSLAGVHYEPKRAVLPEGTTSVTIKVADGVDEDKYEMIYDTYLSYYVGTGGTYVQTQVNDKTLFIFTTKTAGQYLITTSDPEARISYWGASISFIYDGTAGLETYDPESNSYILNVKQRNIPDNDLGYVAVIGVTGAEDCILEITRIGDAILDETDLIPENYQPKTPPKKYTFRGTANKLTYVDLTAKTGDVKIVMGSDGYYHLNSATGPLLYMRLGTATVEAPYVTMYKMLGASGVGGTSFTQVFYENGNVVRKEDYTECMLNYVNCADSKTGVYPLTEDLVYMMQNGGDYKGWWKPENANCLFKDENGNLDTTINLELAWMFAICYVP